MSTARSIFISYRRDDTQHITGRIYDYLEQEFGDAVFKDVDNIPLGVDFRTYIDQQVSQCQICIAVIGANWLSVIDHNGQRRLDNPGDFVRLEIETVLKRNIPVIPVLVDGAQIPTAAELPDSLSDLAYRNGAEIQPDPNFRRDVQRLIRGIQAHFTNLTQSTPSNSPTVAPAPTQIGKIEPPSKPSELSKPIDELDEFANLPARYQTLKDYLVHGCWREADQETFKVMLEVSGQTKRGYLEPKDIAQFPCEDLLIIDRLWVKYSNGRFGFSVQKQIYIESGNQIDGKYHEKEFEKFGNCVGWRDKEKWLLYSSLTFSASAPTGHLPLGGGFVGFGWLFWLVVLCFSSLAHRLVNCSTD